VSIARKIIIGSRGSKLALYQSNLVARLLQEAEPGLECEVRIIHTKGDKILDVALSKIGDKGLFTKELERELIAGEVDLCVHSTKDMPTALPEGLAIMGMPARANAQDVIIAATRGMTIESLPQGARVATGSLRRVAQLLRLRPDIQACEIRGNVDSRVKRVLDGEFDAGILAAAGVERLGLTDAVSGYVPVDQLIPAAGQGAIAIEAREEDAEVAALLKKITDGDTWCAVRAERYVLGALEGGCQVPMGIHATVDGGTVRVHGFVAGLDGSRFVDAQALGDASDPEGVAQRVVDELERKGARAILSEIMEAAE
jgi:hydroxymethylbilane synthase